MAPTELKFKIKLSSGRVLGPLDLERVRDLIDRGAITGVELARRHPVGEWQDINALPELATLLLKAAQGRLGETIELPVSGTAVTRVLPSNDFSDEPAVLPPPESEPVLTADEPVVKSSFEDNEATRVATIPGADLGAGGAVNSDDEATRVVDLNIDPSAESRGSFPLERVELDLNQDPEPAASQAEPEPQFGSNVAHEKTLFMSRDQLQLDHPAEPERSGVRKWVPWVAALAAVALAVEEVFFPSSESPLVESEEQALAFKPRLPVSAATGNQPEKSQKAYLEGMKFYLMDTAQGYRAAAEKLLAAAEYDANNTRALAMLASSYLNLLDSGKQEDEIFQVISKLLEMCRARAPEKFETVIADVEFFVNTQQTEAAQNRVLEFLKSTPQPEPLVYFYSAYAFYSNGDPQNAARSLGQVPESSTPMPKLHYLRGLVAEKLGDDDAAEKAFLKAISVNADHSKSHLRLAMLYGRTSRSKDAKPHLEKVIAKKKNIGGRELSQAYALRSQLYSLDRDWPQSLRDIERALALDPKNADYRLEMYSLRARLGETSAEAQKDGQMYHFLSEGERKLREGALHDALAFYLKARQANLDSALPLEKLGDFFIKTNDFRNAKLNLKLAHEKDRKNPEIAAKYLSALIRGYEWDEAEAQIATLRSEGFAAAMLDQALGDLYFEQGRWADAAAAYRRAMARESLDSSVYVSFGKTLAASGNCKEAPFFYSLGMRFDPFNNEAWIATAKCVAQTDSLEQAVNLLQERLQKARMTSPELLTAIAELQVQRGEIASAFQFLEQARTINPDFALPWLIEARIYRDQAMTDRKALQKAVDSYSSFIERNPNDARGYIEKHEVLVRKLELGAAEQELNQVIALFPKYPGIHLLKGELYVQAGNFQQAAGEFEQAIAADPKSDRAHTALGAAKVRLNKVAEGLKSLNLAIALNPRSAEAKFQAGIANAQLKNFAGAAALFEAASALDPGNPLIWRQLGYALRDGGQAYKARAAFRKYIELAPDASDRREIQNF